MNTRGQRNFTEHDVTPWSKRLRQVSQFNLMPKFFTKRKERCNLRSRSKNQSTPKSKVDACVECDLPFDESKIAPELRRGPVTKEGTSSDLLEPSHKNSVGFDKTSLVPVDISVVSDSDDSLSALASGASELSQNLRKNFTQKKKRKRELYG